MHGLGRREYNQPSLCSRPSAGVNGVETVPLAGTIHMAVKIKRVELWRTEIRNKPGVLAATLQPLAERGADLKVVMKYSVPGRSNRATVEIFPGTGRRAALAARTAGFSLSPTPVLLIEGENRPGLAYAVANTVAWAGISVRFLSAQVVGKRYSALLGFRTDEDARKAGVLIRRVAARKKVAT